MQSSSGGHSTHLSVKMGVWLLMITIAILFGSLSLAYIVNGQTPRGFSIPWSFYANTIILLASSILLHIGWVKRHEKVSGKILRPAVLLGLTFLLSQSFAWYQLYDSGMDWISSGQKVAYLYLLTALHALHLIGGIFFLIYVWVRYQRSGRKYLESAVFFWHFLGVLWVYLLCVLVVNA